MKKIISIFIYLILFLFVASALTLMTIGISTNKFNNLISEKISQANNNVKFNFNYIKFKLDIKKISLFLETIEPKIKFHDNTIPIENIKVYVDFFSLIKSDPKIKKIKLTSSTIDLSQIKKMLKNFSYSNLTKVANDKLIKGQFQTELEIYFNDKNILEDFIAKGTVTNLKAKVLKDLYLEKVNFDFFSDKTDVIFKNLSGEVGPAKISEADLTINLSSGVAMKSNFISDLKYEKSFSSYLNYFKNFKYSKNISNLEARLNNTFEIKIDKNLKIKNYNLKTIGKISKASLYFEKPFKNFFSEKNINQISLVETEVKSSFNSKKTVSNFSGKYALNESEFLPFKIENDYDKNNLNLSLKASYKEDIKLEIINYSKPFDKISEISLELSKKKNDININSFNFSEGKNSIDLKEIKLKKNKLLSFDQIAVKTSKDGKKNNDFLISFANKIIVNGDKFDATNFPKIFSKSQSKTNFNYFSNEIEINFKDIIVPLSEKMKNFKLIGKIENGEFVKISSKGDYGENNYLDISLKNDQKTKKKYLEIYSDLTRPLLTEFNFFKGLTGGKLLYSSIIDGKNYNSKLIIENFKVVNAPGMIKLLSLADLGGLADLAEGDGISFDILEIEMEKINNTLNISEILALGPSISVLMDGYKDDNVTSLRGTLIPAKTLNKMISKIPVIGDIIIPKEVGEGLFGISFKMKGPPGKIKTI